MSLTILDGGMGRELLRIGAPFRQPEWSALALMDGPEWVVQAHHNFVEAGAQVITTNSYACVPFHIGQERFETNGHQLVALAGQLARRVLQRRGSQSLARCLRCSARTGPTCLTVAAQVLCSTSCWTRWHPTLTIG